jgi:hypothetical protein
MYILGFITFYPWPTKSRQFGGGILRPLCPLPLSGSTSPRYAIPTPKMTFPFVCTNHLITHRNPHRPLRHLRGSIYTTTVRPRQVLVPNRNRRRALDRLYIDCLLPPGNQPGQLTNAQLRARRSRERPYLRPGVLGFKLPDSRRWFARRFARSLLVFRWLGQCR